MKNVVLFLLAIFVLASCGPQQDKEQQSTEASTQVYENVLQATPDKASIVFENDYTRIIRITLEPGEEQPLHKGKSRAIYALTSYELEWQEEGEDKSQKSWSAGQAHWHEAGVHAAKNIGNSTAEYLVVERTGKALPECDMDALNNDVYTVASDRSSVLLENEHIKITKVSLPSGETIPEHSGINRIIYSLSDYTIDYTSDKEGEMNNKTSAKGEAHWHEACQHSLKNAGETAAEFLVLAMKD